MYSHQVVQNQFDSRKGIGTHQRMVVQQQLFDTSPPLPDHYCGRSRRPRRFNFTRRSQDMKENSPPLFSVYDHFQTLLPSKVRNQENLAPWSHLGKSSRECNIRVGFTKKKQLISKHVGVAPTFDAQELATLCKTFMKTELAVHCAFSIPTTLTGLIAGPWTHRPRPSSMTSMSQSAAEKPLLGTATGPNVTTTETVPNFAEAP